MAQVFINSRKKEYRAHDKQRSKPHNIEVIWTGFDVDRGVKDEEKVGSLDFVVWIGNVQLLEEGTLSEKVEDETDEHRIENLGNGRERRKEPVDIIPVTVTIRQLIKGAD